MNLSLFNLLYKKENTLIIPLNMRSRCYGINSVNNGNVNVLINSTISV